MNREELLARVTVDPNVCFGKPRIHGHRIWVSLILDFLASGWTIKQIFDNYPGLEEADVYACIAYGAEMARERIFDVPVETRPWGSSWTRASATGELSYCARLATMWPRCRSRACGRLPTKR